MTPEQREHLERFLEVYPKYFPKDADAIRAALERIDWLEAELRALHDNCMGD